MTSNMNVFDFSCEKWAQLLHQNYNTKIENFANHVSGKEFAIVHYDATKNKLICGRHSLNLSEFLEYHQRENSGNKQVLRERNVKVGDGKPIADNKIQHLARCIHMALQAKKENKSPEPNQSKKSKISEISTKALKRPAETQNERLKKKAKLCSERERTELILKNEFPTIRKLDKETVNVLNENLSRASSAGNIEECKKLIKLGAKINEFSSGNTPLSQAIKEGHLDLVEFLLANDADPNLSRDNSNTLLMEAVIHKRYEICRCLLKKGAEINAKGQFENTAFIEAVKSGDNPMVDLLLEYEQLDINARNSQEKTALFYAVWKNELGICKKLLKLKADPNNATRLRSTPLEGAIIKKNLPIILLLIDYGAKIDYLNKNEHTLLMRATYLYPEVFFKLIEKGANVDYVNKDGKTILTALKERRPLYYRSMVDAIKSLSSQASPQSKIFTSRLMVSHAWHLDGETTITNPTQSYKMSLIGSQSPLWYRQMYKNLPEFVDEFPNAVKHPELLQEALQFASGGEFASLDMQFQRIQTGLPTFIRTGFRRHAIIFLVWGNRWVVCNVGSKSVRPTLVRHFDPQLLTIEDLQTIEDARNHSPEEFLELMERMKKKLHFLKSQKDDYLSNLSKEYLKKQTVGNCSWASPMTAVFAFLMLDAINEVTDVPNPNEPMPAAIKEAIEAYQNWERFQKVYSLQRMLKLIGKTDYNMDYTLIQRVSDRARQDPLLDVRLTALMKKYEPQIIAEMKKMESPSDDMEFG